MVSPQQPQVDPSFLESSSWTLGPATALRTPLPMPELPQPENPSATHRRSTPPPALSLQMAYQGANLGLFVPPNMHCVHVENHIPMVRLVAGH